MTYIANLKDAISNGTAIVVAGTGVSKALSGLADAADWVGLIRSGIDTVEKLTQAERWASHARSSLDFAIEERDTAELIGVASTVQTKLQGIGAPTYASWLRDTIGALEVKDPALGAALHALACPIVTTNYDELLEIATSRRSAVWTDVESLRDVMSNEQAGVAHVHGIWRQPDSVVLSEADYSRVLGTKPAQHLQSAFYATKSFLFVGYGSGLEDPNFGRTLALHASMYPNSRHDHYRLVRESELQDAEARHANDSIRVISYGEDHSDLVPFLESLVGARAFLAGRDYISFATEAIVEQLRGETILGDEILRSGVAELDELTIPPVLLPMPHDQFSLMKNDDTMRPTVHDLDEICDGRKIYIVAGEEGAGVSTAVRWLVTQTAQRRAGVAPLYVDARRCRGPVHALDKEVRSEAIARRLIDNKKDVLPAHLLAIDNVIPAQSAAFVSLIEDLRDSDAETLFIGVRQGLENEVYEALAGADLPVDVVYLGKPGRAQAQALAKLVAPDAPKGITDQVLEIIRREHLQRTPFNIILLLVLLSQGAGSMTNASDTAVLDKYVQLLLGRNGSFLDPRWSLDPQNREVVLSNLAMTMVRARAGSLSKGEAIQHFSDYFKTVDWSEDADATMESLAKMRLLRISGDRVSFQQSGYLHLFAAKAAQEHESFLNEILAEPLYFAPIIRHYAALVRNSERVATELLAALRDNWASAAPQSPGYAIVVARPAPELRDAAVHASDSSAPGSDYEELDEYDASDDRDAAPFPLDDPSQWPLPQQLTWILDLASRVVRDSDQIRDLALKDDFLVVVLDRWGYLLDELIQQGAFDEVADAFVESAAQGGQLDGENQEDVRQELRLSMSAYYVLAGMITTLASRKLLLALDRVTSDQSDHPVYFDVSSALLALVTNEAGWAANLPALARDHGTAWVVSRFIYPLVRMTYRYQRLTPEDQRHVEDFVSIVLARNYSWPSDREKKQWLSENLQRIRDDRIRYRPQRLGEGELAIEALGTDPDDGS